MEKEKRCTCERPFFARVGKVPGRCTDCAVALLMAVGKTGCERVAVTRPRSVRIGAVGGSTRPASSRNQD